MSLFSIIWAAISAPKQHPTQPIEQSTQPKRKQYMKLSHAQEQAMTYLATQLTYDTIKGEFRWKVSKSGRVMNTAAGAVDHNGYIKFTTKVDNKRVDVKAHRLAVFMMSMDNHCPPLQADSIVKLANGKRDDIRWDNIQIF